MKAYDPKWLLECLKEEGISFAVESSDSVLSAVSEWIKSSAKKGKFDIKGLLKALDAEKLELAEDAAEGAYRAVKKWFKESAAISANTIDDMVAAFLPQLDQVVEPVIDKINPADNE